MQSAAGAGGQPQVCSVVCCRLGLTAALLPVSEAGIPLLGFCDGGSCKEKSDWVTFTGQLKCTKRTGEII